MTDFLRTDNIGRFSVVYDSTVVLDNDDPQKDLQIRVPMPKVLRYGGSGANQTRSGHYFIMACANVLGPADLDANHPFALSLVCLSSPYCVYSSAKISCL